MRQAGFFFFFFFPPQNKWGSFFFYPIKFDLKFKCKQKWKVCVICILPGLRLLGHAARTSLGFMFRVGTGFMQQCICNTQMLRHNPGTDEVCCQNNQSYPLVLRAIFGDRYCIPLGYFFIITISSNFFILKNTLFSSFPNYLFSFRSFDKSESVISSLDKSAKTSVGLYFCIILIKFLDR